MISLRRLYFGLVLAALAAPAWADFADGVGAYNRGDFAAAIAEWRPLANGGDPTAQFNLGVLYEYGQGVPLDPAEAARWYRLGAEQGNAFAQKALGVLYNAGKGVEKDDAEAVRWYRSAAEQDFPEAQFNLGMSYAKGEGVAQDRAEAHFWLSVAANSGEVIGAQRVLAAVARFLEPVEIAATRERMRAWLDPARLADTNGPTIEIADAFQTQNQTIEIGGVVTDRSKIAAFTIQDEQVAIADDGDFATTVFVPLSGVTVRIAAIDEFGNRT